MRINALQSFLILLCTGFTQTLPAQNGNFLWARNASVTSVNAVSSGNAICTDTAGNVIIAGSYGISSVAFGATTLAGYGGISDIYIVKYTPAGNLLWAKSIGGTGNDYAPAVCTDRSGNIIVAGAFTSSRVYFGSINPQDSLSNTAGGTYFDFLLAKYDPNGNVLWAKNAACSNDDGAASVATDAAGNIYMAGDFYGNISFGSTTLNNADGSGVTNDAMLVKYDAGGNFLWANAIGNTGWETSSGVKADSSGVYITGSFSSTSISIGAATLSFSNGALFLAKYDTTGNPLWAKNFGGESTSLSLDPDGNVFMTGNFNSNVVTFGPAVLFNTAPPTLDLFLVKFDAAGNTLWATSAGGSSSDKCFSSSADAEGNVYIAGTFWNNIAFGAVTLTDPNFSSPVFIAKYGPDGNLYCVNLVRTGGNQLTDAVAAGNSGDAYLAATFYTNPLIVGPDTLVLTGNYQVFTAKYNCCGLAAVQYSSDTTILPGNSVTLSAAGGIAYAWSTGETTPSIVVAPTVTTDYCVLINDSGNCLNSKCIRVNVVEECSSPIFIANAFSPNNDGENDYVQVHLRDPGCVSEFYIAIYDRWGTKIYESSDPGFKWDGTYRGKTLFSQVVTYYIRTISVGGTESVMKGNISLIL